MLTPERRAELFTTNGRPRVNTFVIFEGPSRINGSPIIVFATGFRSSKNSKTGAMLQTHIVRADMDPLQALRTGADSAVCGACVLRPRFFDGLRWKDRACYVRVDTAPLGIWRAWAAGNVPAVTLEELAELTAGYMARLGSYGDPAAVPLAVWDAYTARAAGWTGYTHQARSPKLRDVLKYCQVSADSLADAETARGAGTGSFRVLRPGEKAASFETLCPASEEAGRVKTCDSCRMCSGANGAAVVIAAHGGGASKVTTPNRRPLSLPVLELAR